jgi:polyhydroxyalkanoate synthesis repressor PhaR
MTKGVNMTTQVKVLKRYSNRKLYDTAESQYVNLTDVMNFLKEGLAVTVIENETKIDVTKSTLATILLQNADKLSNDLLVNLVKQF